MENNRQFESLIPQVLRSIPYILQTHVLKAYCALENIHAQKPHLSNAVWDYCTNLIRDDEPKVAGIIAPELYDLQEIVDPTSGRGFGPDWILDRGLMPLSYWAMHKKVEEVGFPAMFQHFLAKALDHPKILGHEISVLAGNWQFYKDVVADSDDPEHLALYLQRFTEFATTTFAHGNDTVFEHPNIDAVPTEDELLIEALQNPGFFGHNVLAYVWSLRLKSIMTDEQRQAMLHNLTILFRWHEFGREPSKLSPLAEDWDASVFDQHFEAYFLDGPTNIHQITLADALLWVWNHHPEHRRLVAANVASFTKDTRP